jgi:hypothetical protein
MSNKNVPTYSLNPAAVADLDGNYADGAFVGGCNLGSCSQGLGIATGVVNPKSIDFARIQDTAPHETQHIGGNGIGAGSATSFDINAILGTDINEEVAFVEAQGTVANNGEIDSTTKAVNKTGVALADGDWVWGVIPVA